MMGECVEESRLVGLWVALFVGKAALIFRDMGRGWGCWGQTFSGHKLLQRISVRDNVGSGTLEEEFWKPSI